MVIYSYADLASEFESCVSQVLPLPAGCRLTVRPRPSLWTYFLESWTDGLL